MLAEKTLISKVQYAEASVLGCIAAIISAVMGWLNLSEFYYVKFKNNLAYYPFGGEGSTPWYYKSETIYTTYVFTSGILFTIGFILSIAALIKLKRSLALLSLSGVFVLTLLQIIMALSEAV